jgi:hypothetical protein
MEISETYPCLKINAPELKKHKKFREWLEAGATDDKKNPAYTGPVATWHRQGAIAEFSDVFVWKDLGQSGSDSDMPQDVWVKLCQLAGEQFAGILWITFLEE